MISANFLRSARCGVMLGNMMKQGRMSSLAVVALGIGSMVGAGIFSLMGQVALEAGRAVWLAFLLGGVVAVFSGLSFGRLGARFPSAGGMLDYFNRAFRPGILAGGLSLVYLLTLLLTVALVGRSFGAYAVGVLQALGVPAVGSGWFTAGVIVVLGVLNMQVASLVGRVEVLLVLLKLGVLLLLIGAGEPGLCEPLPDAGMASLRVESLFGSVGLTFFAYAGYGMMANAAPNLQNPARQLPVLIPVAIVLVALLYVALSLVITREVAPVLLVSDADTAVAAAAAPLMGEYGYLAVAVAALVATASAINATLFCLLRLEDGLAEHSELGRLFRPQRELGNGASWGYVLLLGFCVLLGVGVELAETARIAGVTFLLSYLAVYAAHWKLRGETGARNWEILVGAGLMLSLCAGVCVGLWMRNPGLLLAVAGVLAAAFAGEYLARRCKA